MTAPLWNLPEWYSRQMDPDEEHAWAEHDRRCGHTPASEPGALNFGASEGAARKAPAVRAQHGERSSARASRLSVSSPTPRVGASPSAAGVLLSSLGTPAASPLDGRDAA